MCSLLWATILVDERKIVHMYLVSSCFWCACYQDLFLRRHRKCFLATFLLFFVNCIQSYCIPSIIFNPIVFFFNVKKYHKIEQIMKGLLLVYSISHLSFSFYVKNFLRTLKVFLFVKIRAELIYQDHRRKHDESYFPFFYGAVVLKSNTLTTAHMLQLPFCIIFGINI